MALPKIKCDAPEEELLDPKDKRELTVLQKKAVVIDSESGISQRGLAKKYKVSKTQIQRILSKKEMVLQSPIGGERRRFTNFTKFPKIEEKLVEYMIEYNKTYNKNIKKKVLIEKAIEISKQENLKFAASSGWYAGFKVRNNILTKHRKLRRMKNEDIEEELIKGEETANKIEDNITYEVVVNNMNGFEYEIYVGNQEENRDDETVEIIEALDGNDYEIMPTVPDPSATDESDLLEVLDKNETIQQKKPKREKQKSKRKRMKKHSSEEPETDEHYIAPELIPNKEIGHKRKRKVDTEPPELEEYNPTSMYTPTVNQSPRTRQSAYSMFRTPPSADSGIKIRVKYEKKADRSKAVDDEIPQSSGHQQLSPSSEMETDTIEAQLYQISTSSIPEAVDKEQITSIPVEMPTLSEELQQTLPEKQNQEIQVVQPQTIEEILDNGVGLSEALTILNQLRSKVEFRDVKEYNEFYTKISPAIEMLQQISFKYQLDDLKSQLGCLS